MLARPFALIAAVAAVIVLAPGGEAARAQPDEPTPPAEPAQPDEATMPAEPRFPDVIQPPPGFHRDPAWSEYDGAFRDAAAGNLERARTRLADLSSRWPGHPAERRAAALVERLGEPRRPSSALARGEFVFWSTLGGVALAANLCVAIDCSSDRATAGVYTLTVGSALAASALASRGGIQQGQAQLYNSAQTWGAWNAFLINGDFPEDGEQAGVAIALQVGGLAAGVGLWPVWRPTQGDVALANTFLVWGSVMTLFGHLAADEDPSLRTVVIAGDISLLAGALASQALEVSRGRTFLIDVGGLLGVLAGALVATGADDDRGAGISLMLGTAAGLAVGFVTSRGWDRPPPVQVAPAVIPGPARSVGYGLAAGLTF